MSRILMAGSQMHPTSPQRLRQVPLNPLCEVVQALPVPMSVLSIPRAITVTKMSAPSQY